MRTIAFSFIVIMTLMTSCQKEELQKMSEPVKIQLSTTEAAFVEQSNRFTFELLSSVIDSPGNIMISPYSLSAALSMLANGANGNTKDSILETIGFSGTELGELNQYFKKVTSAVLVTDPGAKIIIANSIWYSKETSIKTPFVQANSQWYNATVRSLDFSLPSAASTINQWCTENTDGLINNIITRTDPYDIIYLLNALYFKVGWSENFKFSDKETHYAPFINDSFQPVEVKMMSKLYTYIAHIDNKLTYVTIPYGNAAFEYIGFLPAEGYSLNQIVNELKDSRYLKNIMNERQLQRYALKMPKVKFSYDIDMNQILSKLGMSIIFNDNLADFTNAFNGENMFVSTVKQSNQIEINEMGTEAASVTSIYSASAVSSSVLEFNRPFIFAIREISSGLILFIGKIGDPSLE